MSDDMQSKIPHIEIWPSEGRAAKAEHPLKAPAAKAEHPPKAPAAFIEALAQHVASQAREVVPASGETQRTVHTVPRLPWKEDDDIPPVTEHKE